VCCYMCILVSMTGWCCLVDYLLFAGDDSVKCMVCSFYFNKLASWRVAALCLAILKPLKRNLLHKESRFDHVSLSLL